MIKLNEDKDEFETVFDNIITAKTVSFSGQTYPMVAFARKAGTRFFRQKDDYELKADDIQIFFRARDISTYQITDYSIVIFFKDDSELIIEGYK